MIYGMLYSSVCLVRRIDSDCLLLKAAIVVCVSALVLSVLCTVLVTVCVVVPIPQRAPLSELSVSSVCAAGK